MVTESLARLRAMWLARDARERQAIKLAAWVTLAGVLFGGVYDPLRQDIAKLEKRLPGVRAETRLLKVQVTEIERLRVKSAQDLPAGASLARRVELLLAERGLKDRVERSDSSQPGQLTLVMKPLPADAWLGWLEGLDQRGIELANGQLVRNGEALKAELLTLRAR